MSRKRKGTVARCFTGGPTLLQSGNSLAIGWSLSRSESGPRPCDSGDMRFGNDYNPLLVTVFLVVWIVVGVMEILTRMGH